MVTHSVHHVTEALYHVSAINFSTHIQNNTLALYNRTVYATIKITNTVSTIHTVWAAGTIDPIRRFGLRLTANGSIGSATEGDMLCAIVRPVSGETNQFTIRVYYYQGGLLHTLDQTFWQLGDITNQLITIATHIGDTGMHVRIRGANTQFASYSEDVSLQPVNGGVPSHLTLGGASSPETSTSIYGLFGTNIYEFQARVDPEFAMHSHKTADVTLELWRKHATPDD